MSRDKNIWHPCQKAVNPMRCTLTLILLTFRVCQILTYATSKGDYSLVGVMPPRNIPLQSHNQLEGGVKAQLDQQLPTLLVYPSMKPVTHQQLNKACQLLKLLNPMAQTIRNLQGHKTGTPLQAQMCHLSQKTAELLDLWPNYKRKPPHTSNPVETGQGKHCYLKPHPTYKTCFCETKALRVHLLFSTTNICWSTFIFKINSLTICFSFFG